MLCTNTMDLIGELTHRMRGALTVVQEYASLMGDGHGGPLSAEQHRICDVLQDRSDEMCRAIDEMLLACHLDAGTIEVCRQPCDVTAIVEQVVEHLKRKADGKSVSLCHRIDPTTRTFGDPAMIRGAISMIVADGIDQLEEGDRFVVAADVDKRNSQFVVSFFAERPEAVRPAAAAKGTGVSSGEFRETRQLSPRLLLVREIVELNLGRLDVRASAGQSECVSVNFPLDAPSEVLRRYLDRVCDRAGSSRLSLCRLRRDDQTVSDAGDDLDHLLRSVAKEQDLIFRTGEDRWLVATCDCGHPIASLLGRFEELSERVNRIRPDRPIPALRTEDLGTWSLPGCPRATILDALQEALDAQASSRVPAHA